jgi:hypothetical protein
MLRTFFGKKESDNMAEKAATIDAKPFKDALDRYPDLIKGLSKPGMFLFDDGRIVCEV